MQLRQARRINQFSLTLGIERIDNPDKQKQSGSRQ
jgi:hypothetical protein